MSRKFAEEIVDLDPGLEGEVREQYADIKGLYVQVGESKCIMPIKYRTEAEKYLNFKVRPDDVWICGMPRSGTTLIEQMVWLIVNDLDFEMGKRLHHLQRTPYLEADVEVSEEIYSVISASPDISKDVKENMRFRLEALKILEATKDRRVIKTHLHFSQLPPEIFTLGCKVIYVARNPKDVMVSLYHLQKAVPNMEFKTSLKKFVELYKRGLVIRTPYWSHIEQAWTRRDLPNFLFIFYEDLTRDLKKSVEGVSEFLEKPLKDGDVEELSALLKFDRFKEYFEGDDQCIKSVNFIRRGKAGGWRDYFDEEMVRDTDKWIGENCDKIGIQFPEP